MTDKQKLKIRLWLASAAYDLKKAIEACKQADAAELAESIETTLIIVQQLDNGVKECVTTSA